MELVPLYKDKTMIFNNNSSVNSQPSRTALLTNQRRDPSNHQTPINLKSLNFSSLFRNIDINVLKSLIQLIERLLSQLQNNPVRKDGNNKGNNQDGSHRFSRRGTSGNDQLRGTNGADQIHGRGGDDTIRGRGGNDKLLGGKGDDTLFGGRGNDRLKGGKGHDTLNGGQGNDRLYGGKGNDVLKGGRGRDVFIDNRGSNTIEGGQGRDEIRFSGKFKDYEILTRGDKFIFENMKTGNINTVSDVERFTFKDQGLSLSTLISTFVGNEDTKYHSIDGSFNNLMNPDIGKVDSPFRSLVPKDESRSMGGIKFAELPNPREISNAVFAQTEPTENKKGLSDMFWLWGQFLDHDITLTPTTTAESAPIPIPIGDPLFDPQRTGDKTMSFDRSVSIINDKGERKQINRITAVIDGSNIYGSSKEVQEEIRQFSGGRLTVDENNRMPKNAQGHFISGDERVNENVGLIAMHTLWVREHNLVADKLAQENPRWNDEKLFQEARKTVVAEMQAITANEFLPNLLGGKGLSEYRGYNPNVSPQVSNEFASAAYRFGHTMLSPNILRLDEGGNEIEEGNLRLRDAFFRPDKIEEAGVDPILRGFAAQTAQAADAKIVDDVRNFLFGPPGAGGFDLASLNIQRGRDHGVASYNDVREGMGLNRITSFDDPIFKNGSGERLASVYKSTDDIDLWVGGLAEDPDSDGRDGLFGSTFSGVLRDQFERSRNGDRFWYENRFSGAELRDLNNLKLSDIIKRTTGVENIQDNAFIASNNINSSAQADFAPAAGAQGAASQPSIRVPVEDVVAIATDTVQVSQAEANTIITRALEVDDAETALAASTSTTTSGEIAKELQQ